MEPAKAGSGSVAVPSSANRTGIAVDVLATGLWWFLLMLPALQLAQWLTEYPPYWMMAVTALSVALACTLFGRRWFLLATLPMAMLGALCLGADLVRDVNLLQVALFGGAMRLDEAVAAVVPHMAALAATGLVMLVLAIRALLRRRSQRRTAIIVRFAVAGGLVITAAVALADLPGLVLRAWPLNLAAYVGARLASHPELVAAMLPADIQQSPRNPRASWNARRISPAFPGPELYVLIIGESVRADRLGACASQRPIGSHTPGILTYCNVMAGASGTGMSVPLLISRDMPGRVRRIGNDSSFAKAFSEVGFTTYWVSSQEEFIAYPDTDYKRFGSSADRDPSMSLLKALHEVLQEPGTRKLVILHSYDAHFRYCDRYPESAARWPSKCPSAGAWPSSRDRQALLDAYDNALDHTMRFIDAVVAEMAGKASESFLIYTSDHGENIFDDSRNLLFHALKFPTAWDTRVPALIWASDSWKRRHPPAWAQLEANISSALMHADIVPTLLGAADISYLDHRAEATNLTRSVPGRRVRWVQQNLGQRVDGDHL